VSLPAPAAWTGPRPSWWLIVSMGFTGLTALALAAEAAWLAWTGGPASAVPLAGAAVYLGHVAALGVRLWWPRPRPRRAGSLAAAPDGGTGVRFGYSGWLCYLVTALLVMTELVVAAVGLGAALSATVAGAVTAVFITAVVLIIGWFLVTMLRLAPGQVILSPAGISHRGLTDTRFVPWPAVAGISADWIGTPVIAVLAVPSPDIRVRRYLGRLGSARTRLRPFMLIRAIWLTADPATVYHALLYYAAHPGLRAELGTPDALARIGAGQAAAGSPAPSAPE